MTTRRGERRVEQPGSAGRDDGTPDAVTIQESVIDLLPPDIMPHSPLEVAQYVEAVSAELRQMARSAKLDALAYFLEMVRLEASIQIEQRAGMKPR